MSQNYSEKMSHEIISFNKTSVPKNAFTGNLVSMSRQGLRTYTEHAPHFPALQLFVRKKKLKKKWNKKGTLSLFLLVFF
jgi:hypothetical protein